MKCTKLRIFDAHGFLDVSRGNWEELCSYTEDNASPPTQSQKNKDVDKIKQRTILYAVIFTCLMSLCSKPPVSPESDKSRSAKFYHGMYLYLTLLPPRILLGHFLRV